MIGENIKALRKKGSSPNQNLLRLLEFHVTVSVGMRMGQVQSQLTY